MDCSGSLQDIEARAVSMIRRAARMGAEIACLPEHWAPETVERVDAFPALRRVAKELQIYVVSGGDFIIDDGSTHVESFLFGPGGLVGSQRKVHLFRREKRRAVPGDVYSIFKVKGARVGIAICHDLVYPEVVRILALKGAEVIFSPARIGTTGIPPWHLYVKARALENRIPVVSPNFLSARSPGGSIIVGVEDTGKGIVYPKVLAWAGSAPKLLVADLKLEAARKLRKQRLRARRVETYSPLLQA